MGKIKNAIIEKFGPPDFIQTFSEGEIVEQFLYMNPIEEEELFDTGIITEGLSTNLPKNWDKVEFIINILMNCSEHEWIVFGKKLLHALGTYLEKNKGLKPNSVGYDFSIPFFESMPHVYFVNYGFLAPDFLLPDVNLLEVIPIYKEEADELIALGPDLSPKVINLLKGEWSNPKRLQISIIKAAVNMVWENIEGWYKMNTPGLQKELKNGASVQALKDMEGSIKVELPLDLFCSYQMHNGEMFFHSYQYLTLDMIIQTIDLMRKLKDNGAFNGYDINLNNNNIITNSWWNEKWIPFAKDSEGNLICIDTDPGKDGIKGQIIYWERVEGPLISKFKSFLDWLLNYMESLYNNHFIISQDGFLRQ